MNRIEIVISSTKTIDMITALLIILIMELLLVIRKKNKQIENNKQSKDEEIEITCCGVEITDEIRDNDLCPKCLEHL